LHCTAVDLDEEFLMIGKTLGHYQITTQLGKGGMGEVYQAKDRKLGRDVAIKVLPEEFAEDTDRVARFQREAKLLASLNHPNIAAIYGLEESSGTNFLVLELVEGQTLADRIKTGPIPVEESLKLALQIAEAFEAAHEKGVIHRDLKPANIKVTPEGKVKVLDFGLAKAFAGEQADLNLSNSPTLSNAATQQGIILGTAAYMSPEQARGKSVDKRADIWAFGCVLYEMLTGRQTWTGATVTDIIAAALAKEPDYGRLPLNIHPDIRKLLNRCLQKDPAERIRDVGDVRGEIKEILADPGGLFAQSVTTLETRGKLRMMLPWVAAAIALTAVIAGVLIWYLKPTPPHQPRQVIRLDHILPEDQVIVLANIGYGHTIAVSPDGNQFVYTTSSGIYLRSVNELNASLIVGTEKDNPQSPFFSPDAQWIGYWSQTDSKLKKIAVLDGTKITLCDVLSGSAVFGAEWHPDNTIFYSDFLKGILRVSANGGTPEMLVSGKCYFPQLLPDGKSLLFTRYFSATSAKVTVQDLQSGKQKELLSGAGAQYLPTGHLVYGSVNGNNLFAIPFDLQKLETKDRPVSMGERVKLAVVSNAGTLVYLPAIAGAAARPNPNHTLVWLDRNGKEELLAAPPNVYDSLRISPDGTKVALQFGRANIGIWDLVRKTMTPLTFDADFHDSPLWTLDGTRIAFLSQREREYKVCWKASNGTGTEDPLGSAPSLMSFPSTWSGEGKHLVLTMFNQAVYDTGLFDIGIISMEGDHKWRPLLQAKYDEAQPQISPDGRWMAYTSNESGKYEVYVRPFPEIETGKWKVSTSGGDSPLWSRDGRELLYRSGDAVMAIAVKAEPALSFETPKSLFRGTYVPSNLGFDYDLVTWDISPDGKRFLMMKPMQSTEKAPEAEVHRRINIVINWFEELKQRVPTK
jgi:serine/threonine protein kinase/Tol biopolymer transport system component